MTPRDYSNLRAKAQAARDGEAGLSNEFIGFMDEATPDTVLAMLDEIDAARAKAPKAKKFDYPVDFEEAWDAYPSRPGASKADAYKAWKARIVAGATPIEMIAGTRKYAAYVLATKTERQYIKQPATFFGPGEHFSADWTVPHANERKGQLHGSFGEQDFSAGIGTDGSF